MKVKEVAILLGLLVIFNFFSWSFLFYLRDEKLRVVFFDVGQGDAILIRTPRKHHILIDGGPGNKVLEKLGREMPFFYNTIDLVILTHPHSDHVSGLIEILDRYRVKEVLCTGVLGETAVAREWSRKIEETGYRKAQAGQRISANDFYLDILYPAEDFQGEHVDDLNTVSIVSRFVFREDYSFLFTGDAYADQEKEIISYKEECRRKEKADCDFLLLNSDVLKVGHHGSRTSTSEEFLEAVFPEVAVIMAGEGNRFGHPHRETLEKLEEHGVKIKRTDLHGDIVFNISSPKK